MNLFDGSGNRLDVGGSSGKKYPWLNMSHKGMAPNDKGNTIYSFSRSHEAGMDGTELDLRMTSDNVIVINHDAEVTGTVNGVETTLRIIDSTYEQLAELVLFTEDGVDYHILKFEEIARMAFFWNWRLDLDLKPQANINECCVVASEIVRDNGLSGKCFYPGGNASVNLSTILANDPLANFNVDLVDPEDENSIWRNIPRERLWRSVQRLNIGTFVKNDQPFKVWDVGAGNAEAIMAMQPQMIQWTGNTDGVNVTEIYLANVTW